MVMDMELMSSRAALVVGPLRFNTMRLQSPAAVRRGSSGGELACLHNLTLGQASKWKWIHEKRVDPRVQSKLRGFAFSGATLAGMSQQQMMALGLKEDEAKSVVSAIGEIVLELEQAQ